MGADLSSLGFCGIACSDPALLLLEGTLLLVVLRRFLRDFGFYLRSRLEGLGLHCAKHSDYHVIFSTPPPDYRNLTASMQCIYTCKHMRVPSSFCKFLQFSTIVCVDCASTSDMLMELALNTMVKHAPAGIDVPATDHLHQLSYLGFLLSRLSYLKLAKAPAQSEGSSINHWSRCFGSRSATSPVQFANAVSNLSNG